MHVDSLSARAAALVRLFAAGAIAALCALPAGANEVMKWNDTAVKATGTGGQNAIQQSRTIAMVQGAVHDALNAIKPRYAAYYFEGSAAAGASPDAAIAAATRTVLVAVIPSFGSPAQRTDALAFVEEAYRTSMAGLAEGSAKANGLAVGQAAGEAMLALRKDDGATRGGSLHAGERPRPVATDAESGSAQPPDQGPEGRAGAGGLGPARLGQRDAVHAAVGISVLAAGPAGADECAVRPGLQRSEGRRRPGKYGADCRASRDCALLV